MYSSLPRLLVLSTMLIALTGSNLTANDTAAAPTTYSGPITITRGGTYTGNWRSTSSDTPAVTITTNQPVIIVNSNIQGAGDLIYSYGSNCNITIRNCNGLGLYPGSPGKYAGRFANIGDFSNLIIENNRLESTSGIYCINYIGNRTVSNTVRIRFNIAHNIDGRLTNDSGGFLDYQTTGSRDGFYRVQFVQLNKVRNVPNVDIAWNQVINEPGASRVEDNISIFDSSGTRSSPIMIRNNYIQGAYNISPTTVGSNWGYSGGGIMLGDGASAFTTAANNQVVSSQNYGIAIAGGHDNRLLNNTLVSSNRLPTTGVIGRKYSRTYRYMNSDGVGVYIYDYSNTGAAWGNNSGSGNTIGWVRSSGPAHAWTPMATFWRNENAISGPITIATEAAQFAIWQHKVKASGVTLGPAGITPTLLGKSTL